MMARRTVRRSALLLAAAGTALLTGCSSSASTHNSTPATTAHAAGSSTVPTTPASTGTTVAGQLPTVYNCGGGAYKPATLLVVCGVASTTITNAHWTSWTTSSAAGTGTLNLPGKSPGPVSLALSDVVSSGRGPQFAQLKATWTATSPDGSPDRVFPLATAPAQS